MRNKFESFFWAVTRISLGWIFLWAFLDKLFGLGFTTLLEASWLQGGSPTTGFLKFATKGPFAEIFQSLSGSVLVDWLFMSGLLFIGLCLMLGIAVRISSLFGIIMLVFMYLAVIPPEHNPIMDDHLIYSFVLLIFMAVPVGEYFGMGKRWSNLSFVRNSFWLK